MRLRPLRDMVWIRPRPELAEETTALKLTLGELSPEQQNIVERANTVGHVPLHHMSAVSADYRSHPDALTFGEVLLVGETGHPTMAQDRPGLQTGDIVSYKRNRISHDLLDPDTPRGRFHLVHEHGVVFRHPDGPGGMPEPLCDQVLTRVDPEGARKALNLTLPLTEEELLWGIVTRVHETVGAHHGSKYQKAGSVVANKSRMMVERVVATGPGRWVKALWDEKLFGPRNRWVWAGNHVTEGGMAGFLSCNDRARFRLHGQLYTVSPWSDFICAFEDDGEERLAAE